MTRGRNQSTLGPMRKYDELDAARVFVFWLFAAVGLIMAWRTARLASGVDFYQFWVVGQAMHRPGLNVYSDDARRELGAEFLKSASGSSSPRQIAAAAFRPTLETYSSPFLYAVFRVFSSGWYEIDLDRYRGILIAGMVFSIVMFTRLLNQSWNITSIAIGWTCLWFAPFSADMEVANVNGAQLAALAVYLWMRMRLRGPRRDLLSGALLGIAIAFKPNIIFVVAMLMAYWLLNGQWRYLLYSGIGVAAGAAAAVGAAAIAFGSFFPWIEWTSAVASLPEEAISTEYGNFALTRVVRYWWGGSAEMATFTLLAILPVIGMTVRRARMRKADAFASDGEGEVLALALGCLLVVLMPRLAWLQYYILTIPAILLLLGRPSSLPGWRSAALIRYVLLAVVLGTLRIRPVPSVRTVLSANAHAVVVVLSTSVLFGMTWLRMIGRNGDSR